MNKRPHRKLLAWQKGMELYVAIFATTKVFPREEIYGVTSQMRRAALSVPSNLAEGAARSSKREFLHFLSNAEGSLSELDTQIEACQRVGYLAPPQASSINSLISECSALIRGLKRSLSGSS
jgi:four helix bundle protein